MNRIVADLHIHSHFSRATSKDLTFEHLARWAQLKGVHVVGTGDIAHPGWLQEMQEKLEPAEDGLFRLKPEYAQPVQAQTLPACHGTVRFLPAGEISNIYKRHGAVRKVHNVVFAPTLEAVARLQAALEKIGNIRSDGRPILGLDSRDLLEIVLETDPRCHLIPAHIWTPWFSLLGSKSGFDSVEECFGDLTPHIFALETGLSSDPPMNWRVSSLDRYTLVSSSDAHSPPKLAREATLFRTELAYDALFQALQSGDPALFDGSIEFFPEEGKYHLDGHRKCSVRWEPATTLAHDGLCVVCGKPVTVGVQHRVETLADRPAGQAPPRTHPYHSLIPLPEILSEVLGVGPNTRSVGRAYDELLGRLGPELVILEDVPLADIAAAGGSQLAEGIDRMRRGQVTAEGGYDGEYGVIRLFAVDPPAAETPQLGLFAPEPAIRPETAVLNEEPTTYPAVEGKISSAGGHEAAAGSGDRPQPPPSPIHPPVSPSQKDSGLPSPQLSAGRTGEDWLVRLNPEQQAAVECVDASLLIVAGPGTGKTRTLTVRIAHLIQAGQVSPDAVLAITFTNKAAGEMAERLAGLLGVEVAGRITVKTFHALGAQLLREWGERLGIPEDFAIGDEEDCRALLRRSCPDLGAQEAGRYLARISAAKNQLLGPDAPKLATASRDDPRLAAVYRRYQEALRAAQMVDFDDLVLEAVRLLEEHSAVLQAVQARYGWISVDEYQDVNLAQYRLLRLLTAAGANLCAIGDPDQAIYGFRGADRGYFLSFQADYPGARVLRLQRSYRSPQSLLDAATQVIARSLDRAAARLWSDFVEQVRLDVYQTPTDRAEAETVVHRIEQMVGGTSYFSLDSGRVDGIGMGERSFADIAVLYRLSAQSRPLIEALERAGIPYQVSGQAPSADRKAVQSALAFLWLLHNPRSRLHLERALVSAGMEPSAASLDGLWRRVDEQGQGLAAAFRSTAAQPDFPPAQRRRLESLAGFWAELESAGREETVAELIRRVYAFSSATPEAAPGAVTAQLAVRAEPHGRRLAAFLEEIALQSEADVHDPRADRVSLMTLHAAKGLEFPVVFIVGCEEGLLPYLPEGKVVDVEEERRLFYVGLTRAQQRLILTHARRRFLFGRQVQHRLSRFVDDIETALKEIQAMAPRPTPKPKPEDRQLRLF